MPDIVVLPENTQGNDFVIGDVHGSLTLLQAQLQRIKPADRLFIVGDLVDRGENSLGVLNLIESINNKRKANGLEPQIHVARGNHEDMLLQYINHRLGITSVEQYSEDQLENHTANGGDWAHHTSNEVLAEKKKYLESLPYIIHVQGKNPFNVVHADMPFDDKTLAYKIAKKDFNLTFEEKYYCTWARPDDPRMPIVDTGRNQKSVTTYCGHTPKGGLRKESGHINLDVGTYSSDVLCSVNHTRKTCSIIGMKNAADQFLQDIAHRINNYLRPPLQFNNWQKLVQTLKLQDHAQRNETCSRLVRNNLEGILDNYQDFIDVFALLDPTARKTLLYKFSSEFITELLPPKFNQFFYNILPAVAKFESNGAEPAYLDNRLAEAFLNRINSFYLRTIDKTGPQVVELLNTYPEIGKMLLERLEQSEIELLHSQIEDELPKSLFQRIQTIYEGNTQYRQLYNIANHVMNDSNMDDPINQFDIMVSAMENTFAKASEKFCKPQHLFGLFGKPNTLDKFIETINSHPQTHFVEASIAKTLLELYRHYGINNPILGKNEQREKWVKALNTLTASTEFEPLFKYTDALSIPQTRPQRVSNSFDSSQRP